MVLVLLSVTAIGAIALEEDSSSRAEKHTFVVAKRQLCFVRRPDLGYVLKTQGETAVKQAQPSDQSVLSITGRPQIKVVYCRHPFDENSEAIEPLSIQPQIEYIAPLFSSDGEIVAIMPEIVVRLKIVLSNDKLSSLCAQVNCTIIRRLELAEPLYYLLAPKAQNADDVFAAVQQLNEVEPVEWAVPNVAFQPKLCGQVVPNDEYFPNQWHLHNTGQSGGTPNADINAPEAWEITAGDPNIVVAVLDSGVDSNHPDLINNLVCGYDFFDNDNSPDPMLGGSASNAHGTACAGLIAAEANNSIGVAGVAPRCKIMPIRIFRVQEKYSMEWVTDTTVAEAIVWAAENNADVVSLSWGGHLYSTIIREAIISATALNGIGRNGKGCVVLAGAGNDGCDVYYDYPAAYPEVIAVGAADNNDQRWDYSNYGSLLEIMAPSGCGSQNGCMTKLWTTDITGNDGLNDSSDPHLILDYTDHFSGTSAACPIAAGVAALILSVNPNLTNTEVRSILWLSAVDLGPDRWDEEYGYGRVDAYAAVKMALDPPQWVSTLFVDDDAPNDPGPGDPNVSDPLEDGSTEHPFDSVQEAINDAISGNTVVIRAGTYTGDGRYGIGTKEGRYGISFRGKAITVRGEDGPEYCIIDCQHLVRGFLFESGEGPDSVLEGLAITNGYSSFYGGGIYCGKDSNPTIVNCVLRGNSTDDYGGGMANRMSQPTLINCMFIGNLAESGGGVFNSYEYSPTLIDCTFIGNLAESGGGMYNNFHSKPVLLGCTFTANSAESGGGMYNRYDSNPAVTNCIFSSNSARWDGGGMWNVLDSAPILTNCIFSGNSADNGGGMNSSQSTLTMINCTFEQNSARYGNAFSCDYSLDQETGPSNVKLINCILWDGGNEVWNNDASTIAISYSDVQNGWPGTGNIDVDPLFANLGYWTDVNETNVIVEPKDPNAVWIDGDYHLKSEAGRWNSTSESWVIDPVISPCIDAGDPNMPVRDELDPNGGIINMGAYGGTEEASKSP